VSGGRGVAAEIRPFAEGVTSDRVSSFTSADWDAPRGVDGPVTAKTRRREARRPRANGRGSAPIHDHVPASLIARSRAGHEARGAALVDSTPIVVRLERFREDLKRHEQYDAEGSVAKTLRTVIKELSLALTEAEETEVFVSAERAAALSGMSLSTVTRICRLEGGKAGAVKIEGSWKINWRQFEQFMRQSP
jgi:hypothetical protein